MPTEWPPRVTFTRFKSGEKEPRALTSFETENPMPAEVDKLKPRGPLLKTAELQVGMRVNVVLNHDTLALDPHGNPFVLQVMETGVPPHQELFPVVADGLIGDRKAKAKILPIAFRRPIPGEDVCFSPAEVFNQHTLPNHGTFVSFCNGKLVTYNASLSGEPDGYEQVDTGPIIKVTHKNGRRFLNLTPVKRMLFSRASYTDEILFVRLYQENELEELVSREQVGILSKAIAERKHKPKIVSVDGNQRRMEVARGILGQDFLGPNEIEKAFGVRIPPEAIPPLDIDPSIIEAARQEGMMLVLRVDKAPDGSPLTIEKMEKDLQPQFSRNGKGRVLSRESFYRGQNFFSQAVPRTGWFFVSKDTANGSDQFTYLDQTHKLGDYVTHKPGDFHPTASDAFAAKPSLQEAIKYLSMQDRQLRELVATDPEKTIATLSYSIVNKTMRQTPVEAVYDLLLYYLSTGRRLLPEKTSLSAGATSLRVTRERFTKKIHHLIVGVGQFDENGIRISQHAVDEIHSKVGTVMAFRI